MKKEITASGKMSVGRFEKEFESVFNVRIEIKIGKGLADNSASLASLRPKDFKGAKSANFKVAGNMLVSNVKKNILKTYGITADLYHGRRIAPDDITLSDLRLGNVKKNKVEKPTEEAETKVSNQVESLVELTNEEQEWLDDLWSLDEAPESIKYNKNFMLHAVKEDGDCLEHTSDELKNDKEIALLAVQNGSSALEHISINLKKEKDVVLVALQNENSLEYASDDLKNDKEVVLVALQNGNSLEYASDDLKNDKDVVLTAIKNNSRDLEYASDELKSDTSFAISVIKSANEKNKTDIFNDRLDDGGVEYFDASIFTNEEVVNELVLVTLIPFLDILINNNVYNSIKIHKEKLEGAIKKDFEVRLEKAKEIINSDQDFNNKITKCFSEIFNYYYINTVACFDKNYNLVENTGDQDWSGLLSQRLFEIVTEEIINELENQAINFENINDLIGYILTIDHGLIYSDNNYDDPRVSGKATILFNKLPNYASEADLSKIIYCFRSEEHWNVFEDCTDALESIMEIVEEKMSDKSTIEKLTLFDDIGLMSAYRSFSSSFKGKLLEEINKMDEDEKEDLYSLDEILEYLED
jgi:hypothetical protein